jgi:hypothetical protein
MCSILNNTLNMVGASRLQQDLQLTLAYLERCLVSCEAPTFHPSILAACKTGTWAKNSRKVE